MRFKTNWPHDCEVVSGVIGLGPHLLVARSHVRSPRQSQTTWSRGMRPAQVASTIRCSSKVGLAYTRRLPRVRQRRASSTVSVSTKTKRQASDVGIFYSLLEISIVIRIGK